MSLDSGNSSKTKAVPVQWTFPASRRSMCPGCGCKRPLFDIQRFFQRPRAGFQVSDYPPNWGSRRRAEQQAYEDRLDEAMKRAQVEKGAQAES